MSRNEVALFNQETAGICTKVVETVEDKKAIYNALQNPSLEMNDLINQKIRIYDVYIADHHKVDEETGEVEELKKIVLFLEEGESVATTSKGVLNSLATLTAIFGQPTWQEGLEITVKQKAVKNGSMFYLEF